MALERHNYFPVFFVNPIISKLCNHIYNIPIDSKYFYDRIDNENIMTETISNKIYELLLNEGYLDDNNYLIKDPRNSNWRNIIRSGLGTDILSSMNDNLIADESPISEEMNVAYSMHEVTDQCNQEMLQFINQSVRQKLPRQSTQIN